MPINPVTSGMVSDKEFLARKTNEIINAVNRLEAAITPATPPTPEVPQDPKEDD